MTTRVRHLVAYGTLMSTCRTELGRLEREAIGRRAELLGVVELPGILYDMGACPAAIIVDGRRNRHDRFVGQLWRLTDDAGDLLALLDRYEGCGHDSPRPFPYVRRRTRATTPTGARVTTWFYAWNRPTTGLQRCEPGLWRPRDDAAAISTVETCAEALAAWPGISRAAIRRAA